MATILESNAVFNDKAKGCGLSQANVDRMRAQNISTLGVLAFACCQPGETASEDSLKRLIQQAGGPEPTLGEVGSVRRLVFLAQTLAVAEVKASVEGTSDATKKELAPAERVERMANQKTTLVGLSLSGELECSHGCYDLVWDMLEKNTVLYLAPSKFPSRRAELTGEKMSKDLVLDSSRNIKVNEKKAEISCDTSTELLLTQALTRRALAFDLVNVASYAVMERYNTFLMSHLQEAPPPGYARVSIHQVLQADQQAFLKLAEKLPGGIRRRADGTLPLDVEIPALEHSSRVTFHLLPLPSQEAKRTSSTVTTDTDPSINKWARKGKGKGKGKPPKGLPDALKDKVTVTKTGKRICWMYNLPEGCKSGVKDGQSCDRGLHICAEPRCGKAHSMQKHA